MNINLNDFITFVGTPTLIEWTYGDCATLSAVPISTEPTITDTALGTIDPDGGTPGTYTYSVSYTDSAMTNPSGCHDYCVEIQVTIFAGSAVNWINSDDGWVLISGGAHDGEDYYHICCFNGTYGAGNDPGDLTFNYTLTPVSAGAGTRTATFSVDGNPVVVLGPTTFGVSHSGGSYTINSTQIAALKAAGSNVGVDIAEFTITLEFIFDSAYDDDGNPLNDDACVVTEVIHVVVSPCIDEAGAVLDCATAPDPTDFDLYDFILTSGNTAPDDSLTGGVGNQSTTPGPGLGGTHEWELTNVNAELYAAITAEAGAVVKTGPDTINVLKQPVTSSILSLDLTALATTGSHTFDLQHIVTFNETDYQCFSTGVVFDIDTGDCCSVNLDTADPITVCN